MNWLGDVAQRWRPHCGTAASSPATPGVLGQCNAVRLLQPLAGKVLHRRNPRDPVRSDTPKAFVLKHLARVGHGDDHQCGNWRGLPGCPYDHGGMGSLAERVAPRPHQLPRKAKHCIFMFMQGGVIQIDTFDYTSQRPRAGQLEMCALPANSASAVVNS